MCCTISVVCKFVSWIKYGCSISDTWDWGLNSTLMVQIAAIQLNPYALGRLQTIMIQFNPHSAGTHCCYKYFNPTLMVQIWAFWKWNPTMVVHTHARLMAHIYITCSWYATRGTDAPHWWYWHRWPLQRLIAWASQNLAAAFRPSKIWLYVFFCHMFHT